MSEHPYEKFCRDKLILRDFLAADRTILANERTLLAYVRTALALVVLGITCWHFLEQYVYKVVGMIFISIGFLVFFVGLVNFSRMHKKISRINHN